MMSLEPESLPEKIPTQELGSLGVCFVDGDAEQQGVERRVRRRALAISVALQSAVFALIILLPLFGKTQRLALAFSTPIPPYSPYRAGADHPGTPRPNGTRAVCHFCLLTNIPPTIVTRDSGSSAENTTDTQMFEGMIPGGPGEREGLIPIPDSRRVPPPPEERQHKTDQPRRLRFTTLDPAMLIHRVEPAYPLLARQVHKEGRVELRAIIATDGTIQSLQVVSGDPFFITSAIEAVRQWRYKPTYLNGQPVEIDTYITVVYTLQH
jgi:protein TonB